MNETTSIQIPSRVVETHRQFVAAAKAARAAGPDEEERARTQHLFATTYHAFQVECRGRGLDITTMRSLLGEPGL